MMRALCIVIFLLLLIPLKGHASKRSKWFSLYTQYHSYTDLRNNSGNEFKTLSPDFSLNLDIRLVRIFILTLHGGQSFDSQRTHSGIGLKVDLPGFFMIGGSINDLIRRKKRKGINTSIHWKTYIFQNVGQGDRYVGNRFSFSADMKLTKALFLNLDLGLFSNRGDQYLSPTAGLGIEF